MDKYISIFFSLLILVNAYIIRKAYKNWLYPSSLYCLFWFGYTFFPLLFVTNAPIEPLSIFYIYISTLTFTVTTFFFPWKKVIEQNSHKKKLSLSFLNKSFYILSILSFIFLLVNSVIQGFSLEDLIFNFFESSASYTDKRYSEEIISNPFSQLSNIFTYTSLPLAGIIINKEYSNMRKLLIIVLSFLPTIFIMTTQSSKGALFLAITLFYGGVLIGKIFNSQYELINKKSIKLYFVFFIFVLIFTIISFLARGLYDSDYEIVVNALKFNFRSYAFGHLYAFSDWFSFYLGKPSVNTYKPEEGLTWGFFTFMPIFYLFGSKKVIPLGVFDEYLRYEEILQTNIYTWYRGLILDFGMFGSLLFIFILGLLLNLCYYHLLSKLKPAFSLSLYAFMIGYFYTSFIISLLIWKSIYASILLLYIIFKINYYKINIKVK